MTASDPADLHLHLRRLLAAAAGAASDAELQAIQLSPPKNRAHGDAAFGTFALAKLRGVAPPQLAASIAAAARPDEVVESVTAAGPFVNARFRRSALARHVVLGVLRGDAPFARSAPSGKSIVIDFSSPNIAKPFHMGHLRSTVIGAAIGRIWRHLGAEVHGINHLGDWGMPFAKMMTAWMHWGDQKELEKSPMRHMFELYKLYSAKAKENPALDDEAAAHFRALESGEDNEERRMWQFLRDESLAAFQGPYDRLGVTFENRHARARARRWSQRRASSVALGSSQQRRERERRRAHPRALDGERGERARGDGQQVRARDHRDAAERARRVPLTVLSLRARRRPRWRFRRSPPRGRASASRSSATRPDRAPLG